MTDDNTKESLIDFPTYFPIKVIGENNEQFETDVLTVANEHFPNLIKENIQLNASKNKNYLAITLSVYAEDKPSLDAFYIALNKIKSVKMVL